MGRYACVRMYIGFSVRLPKQNAQNECREPLRRMEEELSAVASIEIIKCQNGALEAE